MARDTETAYVSKIKGLAVETWEYNGATLFVVKYNQGRTYPGYNGHYCGYCTLPKPLSVKDHEDVDMSIGVHGGITFFSDDRMTYGFDCNHWGDSDIGSATKNIDWVKAETERMADQLISRIPQGA